MPLTAQQTLGLIAGLKGYAEINNFTGATSESQYALLYAIAKEKAEEEAQKGGEVFD